MDDFELERIASDNPALTAPAAQRAPVKLQRSSKQTSAPKSSHKRAQEPESAVASLSKYDVGGSNTYLEEALTQ